jgi:hypothetical protein
MQLFYNIMQLILTSYAVYNFYVYLYNKFHIS